MSTLGLELTESLRDYLLPDQVLVDGKKCPGCGAVVPPGHLRCSRCYGKLALRYSSDMDPDGCDRKIALSVRNAPESPAAVHDELRKRKGHVLEDQILDAWERSGLLLRHRGGPARQVRIKPARPSAWAWTDGKADALVKLSTPAGIRRAVVDVKAMEKEAFDRALRPDGHYEFTRLPRRSALLQISTYRHELVARGLADTAALYIVDASGNHPPQFVLVEADYDGHGQWIGEGQGLLVPLAKIIEVEERRARVLQLALDGSAELPPVPLRDVTVKVWKGRERSQKAGGGREGREPEVTGKLTWECRYCPFRGASCDPGEDLQQLDPVAHKHLVDAAVETAWFQWDEGHQGSPISKTYDGAEVRESKEAPVAAAVVTTAKQ